MGFPVETEDISVQLAHHMDAGTDAATDAAAADEHLAHAEPGEIVALQNRSEPNCHPLHSVLLVAGV